MKYGVRFDGQLSSKDRVGLVESIRATDETLAAIAGKSHASFAVAGTEVRIEQRTPISNQGEVGSCYANAWCDAMELLMPRDHVVQLSRLFAYFNSRLLHGDACEDSGTYGATMTSACQRIGVCSEAAWPYDGRDAALNERVFVRPELSNYEEAYDHRTDSSYWIRSVSTAERVRRVCDHLDNGFPVVAALAIGQNWDDPRSDAILSPVSNIEGGHAVVLDGYYKKSDGSVVFDVRNSWGEGWARKGHVYISASFLDVAFCDRLDAIVLSPHFGGQ